MQKSCKTRSIFDQRHTPILIEPFSRRYKTILDNFNYKTTNETRKKLSNSFFQQRGKYVLNNEKPIPNLNSKQVTKVIARANAQQQ